MMTLTYQGTHHSILNIIPQKFYFWLIQNTPLFFHKNFEFCIFQGSSGILELESDTFKLHCTQTLTGIKFIIVADLKQVISTRFKHFLETQVCLETKFSLCESTYLTQTFYQIKFETVMSYVRIYKQTNKQRLLLYIYRYTSVGTHPCLETKFFPQKSTFST